VTAFRVEDIPVWHTYTDGGTTFIKLPCNAEALFRADPFYALLRLIYEKLEYLPVVCDKSVAAQTWSPEQVQIIQGIGLWVHNPDHKFDANIRKGWRKGFLWAARHIVKVPTGMEPFTHLPVHKVNLATLLYNEAWRSTSAFNVPFFEGQIKAWFNTINVHDAVAYRSWVFSEDDLGNHLRQMCIWNGNKQLSTSEQKLVDSYIDPAILSITEPESLTTEAAVDRFYELFLGKVKRLSKYKKRVEGALALRLPIYLGRTKREVDRNKAISREVRMEQLRNDDNMWNAFQPQHVIGVTPFNVRTPNISTQASLSAWKDTFTGMFNSYMSGVAAKLNALEQATIESWWQGYLATL
jgi:hypothetical protein